MNKPQATSADDYNKILERVTADLLDKSETFRKTIVYREMSALAAKWAAFIGIANVVALVGIYFAVSAFMQQTIAEKATKAVTEKNQAVDESVKELTKTAISQVGKMQSQLDQAQASLSRGNEQVARTVRQAMSLAQTQEDLSKALKQITDSRAFFNDPKNIERLSQFVTIISTHENARVLGDLASQIEAVRHRLAALEAFPKGMAESLHRLEDEQRKELNRAQDDNNRANDALSEALGALGRRTDSQPPSAKTPQGDSKNKK